MRIHKFLFFLVVVGFSTALSHAQNLGSSPYSRLGVGDMADPSFSRNAGMGGAGVALYHHLQLNSLNPAALSALKFTNLDFGITGKKEKLYTADDAQYGTSGNIHHVSLSLPLSKRYVAQIGARPFSSVNYQDVSTYTLNEKVFEVSYKGSGGLGEFFIGNAYNYKDWLMVGVNMGYITGQTTYNRSQKDIGNYLYADQTKLNQTCLRVSPGILITKRLRKLPSQDMVSDTLAKDSTALKRKPIKKMQVENVSEDWFYGIGVTGSFFHTVNAFQAEYFSKSIYDVSSGNYYSYSNDTLSSGYVTSSYKIPSSLRVGLSLYKQNKISYALDYSYCNWSSYPNNTKVDAQYRAQSTLAAGMELIPSYGSSKLYKRIAYRAGASVGSLPYTIEGQSFMQWQGSLGAGIVLPKSGVLLNVSLAYGQRGTTATHLIKENYALITIGVISNNKWFIRHKHD
jgi:hypothetical protein